MTKKNFSVDQRVKFVRTGDVRMDGHSGRILGKSSEGIVDFYIVLFDYPLEGYNQRACTMIESCLESWNIENK